LFLRLLLRFRLLRLRFRVAEIFTICRRAETIIFLRALRPLGALGARWAGLVHLSLPEVARRTIVAGEESSEPGPVLVHTHPAPNLARLRPYNLGVVTSGEVEPVRFGRRSRDIGDLIVPFLDRIPPIQLEVLPVALALGVEVPQSEQSWSNTHWSAWVWATLASSSSQVISIMFAADGCGPGAPAFSSPLATLARSWLCTRRIVLLSSSLTPLSRG